MLMIVATAVSNNLTEDQISQVIGGDGSGYRSYTNQVGGGSDFWNQSCYSKKGKIEKWWGSLLRHNAYPAVYRYANSTVVCAPDNYCVWKADFTKEDIFKKDVDFMKHDEEPGFWTCLSQKEAKTYVDKEGLEEAKQTLVESREDYSHDFLNVLAVKENQDENNMWQNIPQPAIKWIIKKFLQPKGWQVPWDSKTKQHQLDQKKLL